jgi:hypothetical protein
MELTSEEIVAIADRLDDIIGDQFHDAIWDVLLEREKLNIGEDVSDEDIQKIKDELKRTL